MGTDPTDSLKHPGCEIWPPKGDQQYRHIQASLRWEQRWFGGWANSLLLRALVTRIVQQLSTSYGRALVAQHLDHFDLVFSAGPYCRNAFHVRRLFNQHEAFPFDWWVTPASSMGRMLQPEYRFALTPEQIFLTHSAQVALNSRDQILQLHDLARTPTGELSMANLEIQLEQINAKYSFLFERLRNRLHDAKRCLLIFEGLMSATELETYRQRTSCPELSYPALAPSYASDLVAMLQGAYKVEATLVCFSLGPPGIYKYPHLLQISAPVLESVFDKDAEPYQRPWASYDLLVAQLCSAIGQPMQ